MALGPGRWKTNRQYPDLLAFSPTDLLSMTDILSLFFHRFNGDSKTVERKKAKIETEKLVLN